MQYPTELPITSIDTFDVGDVWSPYFNRYLDIPTIYIFRKEDQAFYIGKTLKGRDRYRWHLRNTFRRVELTNLVIDILTIKPELVPNPDANCFMQVPLEHYEAILIRQCMPLYNANIAKTWRKLNNIPYTDDSVRSMLTIDQPDSYTSRKVTN